MKKLIAILLSLTFVLSVSVLAASTDPSSQSSSKEVKATYSTSTGAPTYSVDIAWGSMEFVYSTTGKWNPATHDYDTNSAGTWSWTEGANVVTITNHSDAEINCAIAFEPAIDNITGTISTKSLTLPSAVNKDLNDTSIKGTSTLTLSGKPNNTSAEETVGTISVSIY